MNSISCNTNRIGGGIYYALILSLGFSLKLAVAINSSLKASYFVASPYDLDNQFSMNSLSRLEAGAGINIVTSLATIYTQVIPAAGIILDRKSELILESKKSTNTECLEAIVGMWVIGRSRVPPTWSPY